MATTTNPLAPVDNLISALASEIEKQQPTEAELLQAAQARYDPYFTKQAALVKEYYDMQRRQAISSYGARMSSINAERSALQNEYKLYLEEIETGKLRAGSEEQRIKARALEDKKYTLDQMARQEAQKLDSINRGFISNEGLYSGARQKRLGEQEQAYTAQTGNVEQGYGRTLEDASTKYQEAMQDYLMAGKQKKAQMDSQSASLSGQAAGYSASMQAATEEANYAQKVKEMDLEDDRQKALMNYVYGENAYKYLGL